MKKKKPDLSDPKNQVDSRPHTPPLDPMELATLAALLGPRKRGKEALISAVQCFIDSRDLLNGVSDFEKLVGLYGTDAQRQAMLDPILEKNWKERWNKRLELVSKASNDQVRAFLLERGLKIKTAKAVLENLYRCYKESFSLDVPIGLRDPAAIIAPGSTPKLTFDEFKAAFRDRKEGRTVYHLPAVMLERAVKFAEWRKSESERKRRETRERIRPVIDSKARFAQGQWEFDPEDYVKDSARNIAKGDYCPVSNGKDYPVTHVKRRTDGVDVFFLDLGWVYHLNEDSVIRRFRAVELREQKGKRQPKKPSQRNLSKKVNKKIDPQRSQDSLKARVSVAKTAH